MQIVSKTLSIVFKSGLDDSERKMIIRNTIHSFIIQGVAVSVGFVTNFFFTRWAGASAYGQFIHVFNWISVLGIVALGGRDDLALALIPKYEGSDERRVLRIVKKTNLDIAIRSGIVVFIFMLVISYLNIKTLSGNITNFAIASFFVYGSSFVILNQSILQSMHFVRISQVTEKIFRPVLMLAILLVWRSFSRQLGSSSLTYIASLSSLASCMFLFYLINVTLHQKSKTDDIKPVNHVQNPNTLHFFLISLLYLLTTKISMLTLPYFMSQKDVGVFNIAYRFAEFLIYPSFLMHYVLPQLFAKSDVRSSHKISLYRESAFLMTALAIPILLINIFFGRQLLGIFGKAFVDGYQALILLSIAQLLFSIFGPSNTILMMQGKEKYSVLALAVYVLILLVTSVVAIPLAGLTGAAISLLVSCLIYNVILSAFAYRFFGTISPFFKPAMRTSTAESQ